MTTLEIHNPATGPLLAALPADDALAIARITSHGAGKFSRKPYDEILAMRVVGMDEMAKLQASGALDPRPLAAKAVGGGGTGEDVNKTVNNGKKKR